MRDPARGAVLFSAEPLLRRPALSHCLRSRFCTFSHSAIGECRGNTSSPGMWMALANLDATQCKMARAALGIGVRELAARAVVSPDTVSRLEKGERLHQRTVIAIREAMEAAGVEFLPDGGVRLRPPR